jgi:hypothetical protein
LALSIKGLKPEGGTGGGEIGPARERAEAKAEETESQPSERVLRLRSGFGTTGGGDDKTEASRLRAEEVEVAAVGARKKDVEGRARGVSESESEVTTGLNSTARTFSNPSWEQTRSTILET